MKEFELTFQKGLHGGLRRTDKSKRGDEVLTECFNVVPAKGKVGLHEALTSMDVASSWSSSDLYLLDHNFNAITTDGTAKIAV